MSRDVAILMTPPGSAAIAVVRLSGPRVPLFLKDHFPRPVAIGRCIHGNLTDGSRIIDDALVVLCDETTADINLHGGHWVVQSTLDLAAREGFTVQSSTEAPAPLTSTEAPSELEREVLSRLPSARTETGVRVLLSQKAAWDHFKSEISNDPSPGERIRHILADNTLRHLLNPLTVAIVGAANVGKSTLANQLFARERSIAADMPGTTRDWVGELANIDGLPVMLLDTPGIREADDEIERTAIERSRGEIERADQVVLVLDASRPLEGEQQQLIDQFPTAVRIANKADRSVGWNKSDLVELSTVATTGQGISKLRRALIKCFCREEEISIRAPRCWTVRQAAILRNAADDLQKLTEL
jgi:tRNA modification GTPase